jgi:hypothetical protein
MWAISTIWLINFQLTDHHCDSYTNKDMLKISVLFAQRQVQKCKLQVIPNTKGMYVWNNNWNVHNFYSVYTVQTYHLNPERELRGGGGGGVWWWRGKRKRRLEEKLHPTPNTDEKTTCDQHKLSNYYLLPSFSHMYVQFNQINLEFYNKSRSDVVEILKC